MSGKGDRLNGKAKRDSLFSLYSRNLSFYMPELANQFICPVCKSVIARGDLEQDPFKVSLAHIIPKSMGGRQVTLACAKCDQRIGGEYDWHLSQEKKQIEQLREEDGIYSKLKCGSGTYRAMFGFCNKSNNTVIYIKPPKHVPLPIWKERIDELVHLKNFSVAFDTFDTQKRNISHIYSAFLLMFSKFGYEYVLSANVDPIREVFIGNYLSLKYHRLVVDLPERLVPKKIPSIFILLEPRETRTFLITLPSPKPNYAKCVFLPGFGKSGKEGYHNLVNLIGVESTLEAELELLPISSSSSHLSDIRFKGFGNIIWNDSLKKADHRETENVIDQGFKRD